MAERAGLSVEEAIAELADAVAVVAGQVGIVQNAEMMRRQIDRCLDVAEAMRARIG